MVSAKKEPKDIVIIQEEAPRNEWPLCKIVAITPDQQGLVPSIRINLAVRNFDKKGNSAQHSIIERPVQKVALLLDGDKGHLDMRIFIL